MIHRLVDLSLKYRGLVLAIYVGLAVAGYGALRASAIDAMPDLSDNQVIVFTEWPGHSPQEVEDQITYPLTVNLQGLAGVRVVRSQSAFGFSMIYAVFDDDVDLYFARAACPRATGLVTRILPSGVAPTLGPDATGVGHIFWYTLESPSTVASRAAQRPGLVRPLPTECRAGSRGSRVGRRNRSAIPDRSRSEPASRATALSIGEVVEAVASQQCQRRRQCRRSQWRLDDRARDRAHSNPSTTSSTS